MAKAIIGAVEIGAGVALLVFAGPGAAPFAWGLIMAGAGEEFAEAAQLLQGNPALTASAKLPSAPREVVYGMCRKGGTFIYQSTSGHQLNEVIVWAAHPCDSIVALYVDQRKFYYSDAPTTIVGSYGPGSPYGGGYGDGVTYVDDSGNTYNFSGQSAVWHSCGQVASVPWTAGMVATRTLTGDTASTYTPTLISVVIDGTAWAFGCLVPGTAGGSSAIWNTAASKIGAMVNDGEIVWVNLGPAPGGYWLAELYDQEYAVSQWPPNCTMTGLCTSYFKATYDANVFNGPPQLRATIKGRNDIYDPRTATYGWTDNAALCICRHLCDSEFGFGVDYATGIDEDQLIAAANICDEQVTLAASSTPGIGIIVGLYPWQWQPWTNFAADQIFCYGGVVYQCISPYTSLEYFGETDVLGTTIQLYDFIPATESRYTINGYSSTDQAPGEILSAMLDACEGRITRQGGVYKIYPAAWYGTSLEFTEDDLCGQIKWQPSRKFRDRVNCVRATFVCPQYPYRVVGYNNDYKNAAIFNGEWQPTDAPPYCQDWEHGYGLITDPGNGDLNLVQDGGIRLYTDRRYQFVISAAQCQRLMKIFLLRNRFQGQGTFPMKLTALQAQCQDVVSFTFPYLGMDEMLLEITKFDWILQEDERAGGGQGARPVQLSTQLEMSLTDPSIYDWSVDEEMTLYDQPSPALENPFQVSPPTSVTAVSNLSTALVAPDGTVTPRILVAWTEPADPYVTTGGSIQVQISPHGAGTWTSLPTLSGITVQDYIGNVIAGQSYDIQIRAVRASGAYSAWVQVLNIPIGVAVTYNGNPVAPAGTLTALALSLTTAEIFIANFVATCAGFTVACAPSVSVLIAGIVPKTTYYVYYVDNYFLGGAITPVATTNIYDFLNKAGYWLIGLITTPAYGATSYSPSTYTVPSGFYLMGVNNPVNAYDGNLTTFAYINASCVHGLAHVGWGCVVYSGFPSFVAIAGQYLNVASSFAVVSGVADPDPWVIAACLGGGTLPTGHLGTLNPRGAWAATTAYAAWDIFTEAGVSYLVVTGYTSGSSFGSTDIADTCVLLAYGTGAVADTTYSVPVPVGVNLNTVTVTLLVDDPSSGGLTEMTQLNCYEIWIQ